MTIQMRRAFAVAEFLFAAILVFVGFGSTTAHRVGGDGIATGLANAFGPHLSPLSYLANLPIAPPSLSRRLYSRPAAASRLRAVLPPESGD